MVENFNRNRRGQQSTNGEPGGMPFSEETEVALQEIMRAHEIVLKNQGYLRKLEDASHYNEGKYWQGLQTEELVEYWNEIDENHKRYWELLDSGDINPLGEIVSWLAKKVKQLLQKRKRD